MPFALDSRPELSEISEAVNYLLSNFSTGVTSDPNTGQISGPTGEVIGYLYKYMAVKYADSFDGSVNFSNSPTNRQYYGIRNSDDAAESSNPADYIWFKVSGGFGVTKSLWYISTGGRQIQFAVSVSAPDTGWLVDPGSSIDLDIVTSGTVPVIAETFVSYFTPSILQVPRTGNPLSPVLSGIAPVMYATDKGQVIPFVDAQTDTSAGFVNNTWRIGNSSTTGFADISYTNITIGNPTDAGDYAQWPNPSAMPNSPAYITVPVRYKNSLGVVSQAGVATLQLVYVDPGAAGQQGSTLDISGYTAFVQNAGGAFTPPSATLSAILQNVTSPTYSWTISGATPTSSTASSVVITPTSSSTGVSVSLTVNGSNLTSPLTKTMNLPVVYDGVPGQAGANGVMSAFPTIYIWTGSSTPPTRPSTTSTYTWATGAYTAPSGWSTQAPSNTTPGNYLWSITVPLNASATTVSSTLDWTNVTYPIRAIAFNGNNGTNGTNGTNGANGSNGSATFVVTRFANDSSPPTNAEVNAIIGRNPVAGDICTVSYNNYNNAVVYQYVTSWTLFQTYITGSLIVQNTITADKMVTGVMSADNTLTRGLTVRDNSGNILLAAGTPLNFANITPASGWLNSNINITGGAISGIGTGSGTVVANNQISISGGLITGIGTGNNTAVANNAISINADGTLSGAGGGAVTPNGINAVNVNLSNAPAGILNSNVTLGTLGAGGFAYLNQITSANVSTYIAGAAIGTAQVGVLTAGNIGAGTIDASKIAANTITAGQIAANTITAGQIAANTITASQIAANTITSAQIAAGTISATNMAANSITAANAAIANAAVDTLQIAGSAVTVPAGALLASSTTIGGGVTLLSVGVDSAASPVYISSVLNITNSSISNQGFVNIAIRRNGSNLIVFNGVIGVNSTAVFPLGYFDSSPGSGTNTYSIYAEQTLGNNFAIGGKCSLFAIGTKR